MKNSNMEKSKILSMMGQIEMFQYFNELEKDRFLFVSELLEFAQGEMIIKENEVSPYLYIILEGSADIMVSKPNGESILVDTSNKGEILGEASIFINVKRTAHVVAKGKVTLIQVERNSLIQFMKNNPEAGIKLQMVIIYSLLERLRQSHQELVFERKNKAGNADMENMLKMVGK